MSMPRVLLYLACCVGLAFVAVRPATGAATRYRIEPGEPNEVRFHSEATVESFDGSTDEVRGWIEVDLADLRSGARWRVEVDMASLDTGIGLRNRHMRDNHLHTDEFPVAVFEGDDDGASWPATIPPGGSTILELPGTFTLHGVTRERNLAVTIAHRDDGSMTVETRFPVVLSEHDIPRPKFLMMKLAEEQDVQLELVAIPGDSEVTR